MIRTVAFDIMDTVLRDPFREALEAATSIPLEELFARRNREIYPAFERGEIDEAAYWDHYAAIGVEVDPAAFHRVRHAGTTWIPGMAELLDELAGRVERVTASNYPIWIEDLADRYLDDRFERVLASHHLGVRKPDQAFFDALLHRLGRPAEEVAFIDDRPVNVDGARAAGLMAHQYVSTAQLRTWLEQLGVPLEPSA